MRNMITSWWY